MAAALLMVVRQDTAPLLIIHPDTVPPTTATEEAWDPPHAMTATTIVVDAARGTAPATEWKMHGIVPRTVYQTPGIA